MRVNLHHQKCMGQSRSSQNHRDQTCKNREDGSWSNEEDEVFDGCFTACSFWCPRSRASIPERNSTNRGLETNRQLDVALSTRTPSREDEALVVWRTALSIPHSRLVRRLQRRRQLIPELQWTRLTTAKQQQSPVVPTSRSSRHWRSSNSSLKKMKQTRFSSNAASQNAVAETAFCVWHLTSFLRAYIYVFEAKTIHLIFFSFFSFVADFRERTFLFQRILLNFVVVLYIIMFFFEMSE